MRGNSLQHNIIYLLTTFMIAFIYHSSSQLIPINNSQDEPSYWTTKLSIHSLNNFGEPLINSSFILTVELDLNQTVCNFSSLFYNLTTQFPPSLSLISSNPMGENCSSSAVTGISTVPTLPKSESTNSTTIKGHNSTCLSFIISPIPIVVITNLTFMINSLENDEIYFDVNCTLGKRFEQSCQSQPVSTSNNVPTVYSGGAGISLLLSGLQGASSAGDGTSTTVGKTGSGTKSVDKRIIIGVVVGVLGCLFVMGVIALLLMFVTIYIRRRAIVNT